MPAAPWSPGTNVGKRSLPGVVTLSLPQSLPDPLLVALSYCVCTQHVTFQQTAVVPWTQPPCELPEGRTSLWAAPTRSGFTKENDKYQVNGLRERFSQDTAFVYTQDRIIS